MAAPMKIMRVGSCGVFQAISRSLGNTRLIHTTRICPRLCMSQISGVVQRLRPVSCIQAVTSRSLHTTQIYQAEGATDSVEEEEYHNIIKDTERSKGDSAKHEFQAETRKLLDIVAKSLYSEKEVFIRELISNSSDSLEKLRYLQLSSDKLVDQHIPLEIHIALDDNKKTFTIQDTGVGMTKDELIDNLGTIAKSGSKAFLDEVDGSATVDKNIIGQFGVGFYSTFMVGEKVEVYTQSHKEGVPAYKWVSDGLGSYDMTEAEGVQRGTKIVVHLRGDCYDYAKDQTIKEVIKKYSNFVGVPIYLNGQRANTLQPLWMMETRDITDEMHEEFYRFIANAYDPPRYHLHYKADAPINIRALFYIPNFKPTMFDMSQQTEVAVTLYSRKVMIMSKADHILPKWLRFIRGVVDSEDIPLNLSRELLQDSNLIRKLRWVLTNRLIKFFLEQAKKNPENYLEFYEQYGLFFREGIITTPEQEQREEIARLLRFESSKLNPGVKTTLDEYGSRMEAGGRTIYYICAPNRQLAESSPYMEALRKKDIEVLMCFEPYDELVLMNLGQFEKKNLKSVENELGDVSGEKDDKPEAGQETLDRSQADHLLSWLQTTLGNRVKKTKLTHRLENHPCVITVQEMGAVRHFMRTTLADKTPEERFQVLQPTLEVNPSHPIVKKLETLTTSDPELAKLVAEQMYDNALINAGLMDDARMMVGRLNELMTKALEKH